MVNQLHLDWLSCLDKYRRVGAARLVHMPNVGGVRHSRTLTWPRARFSTPTPSSTAATADTCLQAECQAWWVYLLFTHTSAVLEMNTIAFIRGSISLKECDGMYGWKSCCNRVYRFYFHVVFLRQNGITRSILMAAHPDHNPEALEPHQGLHPRMMMMRKHCLCQVCMKISTMKILPLNSLFLIHFNPAITNFFTMNFHI